MRKFKFLWLKRLSVNYAFFLHETSATVKVTTPNPAYNFAELVKLGCKIYIEDLDHLTKKGVTFCLIEIPFLLYKEEGRMKSFSFWTIEFDCSSQMDTHDYLSSYKPSGHGNSGSRVCGDVPKGILKNLLELNAFVQGWKIHSS